MSNLLDRGVAKFVEGLGVQTPDDLADFAQSVLGQSPHTIESADYDMHESQIYSYRHRNEGQALLPSASGASGLKSRVVGMRDDGARMRDSGSFSRGVRVQESPSERHRFLAHHDVDDFVPMRSLGGSASFSGGTRPAAYMTSMDESVGEFEVEAEGDAEMVDPLSASTPARLTHGRVFSSSLDDARMRPSYDARALFMDHVRDGSFVSSRDDAPHLRSEPTVYGYHAENFVAGACYRCRQCRGGRASARSTASSGGSPSSQGDRLSSSATSFAADYGPAGEGDGGEVDCEERCSRCLVREVCRCRTLRCVSWALCCCGGHNRRRACLRWALTLCVGVAVAFVAFAIKLGVVWGRRLRNLVFALTMGGTSGSSLYCFHYGEHDFGGNVPGADNRTIWTHFNPWIEAANGFGVQTTSGRDSFTWRGFTEMPLFTDVRCATFLLFDVAVFCTLCCALALVASSFVASPCCGEERAAGSGITEIKAFLNGIKIPRVVRFKTMVNKTVGLVFAVVSGLPVGKEGPMIHSGAIIAAGLSQGKSSTSLICSRKLVCDTRWTVFTEFRNDREKRDFVACGAAAGVACAFGAPIGGVLFVLEEGASYWSQSLTFRTFACALASLWVLSLLEALVEDESDVHTWWEKIDNIGAAAGAFSFGQFSSDACSAEEVEASAIGGNTTAEQIATIIAGERHWKLWEAPVFVVIGIIGGLLGAGFNAANGAIARWRRRYIDVVVPPTHNTRPDAEVVRSEIQARDSSVHSRRASIRTSLLGAGSTDGAAYGSSSLPESAYGKATAEHIVRSVNARLGGACGCRRVRWSCCCGRWRCSTACLPRGCASQCVEVGILSLLVTLTGYILSQVLGHCRRLDPEKCGRIFGEAAENSTTTASNVFSRLALLSVESTALCASPIVLQRFNCPAGGWYNDLASLWFAETAENAVHQLFHLSNSSVDLDSADFASDDFYLNATEYHLGWRLIAFSAPLYILTCLVYGSRVPSGIFVPNILVGAGLGRLVYFVLEWMFEDPAFAWMNVHPSSQGIYALVGAASVLGGMARMALSLTAILLECTGGYAFALPLALALFTARFIGNTFNEGLYDIYMEHNGWPFLESKPPKATTIRAAASYKLPRELILSGGASAGDVSRFRLLNVLRVRHTMAPQPVCLRLVERVGVVLMALKMTTHNGFPVIVDPRVVRARARRTRDRGEGSGSDANQGDGAEEEPARRLAGLVLRQQLLVLLDNHWWGVHPDAKRRGLPPYAAAATAPVAGERERSADTTGVDVVAGVNAALRDAIIREARAGSRYAASTTGENLGPHDAVLKDPLKQEHFDVRYPRFPDLDLLQREITHDQRWHCWMDLRPYINCTATTVRADTPFERAYSLFRTLGLRHLVVLGAAARRSVAPSADAPYDEGGWARGDALEAESRERDVVGICTRWDLTSHHAEHAMAERRRVVDAQLRSMRRASEPVGPGQRAAGASTSSRRRPPLQSQKRRAQTLPSGAPLG